MKNIQLLPSSPFFFSQTIKTCVKKNKFISNSQTNCVPLTPSYVFSVYVEQLCARRSK